ncbi:hypothetical protein [Taibaiella koreensis]|uniref:hypothetical protein n=1 Tax=Taibaiella koreensis TaxID=1268548 RepID=UPI000E59B2D3|nr:hypothetical protein [Taibaiella koreensis]
MAAAPVFRERQRFRQWWIWMVLIITNAAMLLVLWRLWDSDLSRDWPWLLLFLVPVLLLLLFAGLRLDTEVRSDGIYVRFFPVQRQYRPYLWEEITHVFVRQYEPLAEYGGWGIRGLGKNKALNVSGNQGLQLILKNGNKLLIGTRRPAELSAVLNTIPIEKLHQPDIPSI